MKSNDTQMTDNNIDAAYLLGQTITLPCGVTVKNRFMKAAMSEVMGSKTHEPTTALEVLYRVWAEGGAGLVLSGNVMIDSRFLGEPGNVVIENQDCLPPLKRWAEAGTVQNTQLWVQINHPGKQIPSFLCREPVAPSAIPLSLPYFNCPRALQEAEIEDIITRFGTTAAIVKLAGFTGIQIHGAHGYLVSQFLSPHHNQRLDNWGGSLENRMRFLLAVYQSIRKNVGLDFPVSLKLNSADFQRGGFTEEESLQVVQTISDAGIDLIEISGGTYEAPAMMGKKQKATSTLQREAYFLIFAEQVRQVTSVPLAVTGGFRSSAGMAAALASGACDLVGLARPMVVTPDLPRRILAGENFVSSVKKRISTGIQFLDKMIMPDLSWYERQMALIAKGKEPEPDLNPWRAAAETIITTGWQNLRRRR
ncbi:NADH:flavin oxidoreductase/NADH oxidase family protein [candidate division CSSED10-310 bacterium]|uniref:NADH:flavin oxidoreductase/NADH oxidase family protein n=1 Tax=candidate division CSSED10-310 bacterium TaxID=2855610 RepID=A0ABV6YY85_UNCC1